MIGCNAIALSAGLDRNEEFEGIVKCTNCQVRARFDTRHAGQWTERKQLGLCPPCFENYLRDLQRQYSEHPDRYAEHLDEVAWEYQRYAESPLSGREND